MYIIGDYLSQIYKQHACSFMFPCLFAAANNTNYTINTIIHGFTDIIV